MENDKMMTILVSLAEKCSEAVDRVKKDLELTSSEYRGMICLLPEDKIGCRELSSKMELSVSRGSRVIESLFKKGFIDRVDCSSDRRCKKVWLTKKGIRARLKISAHIDKCEEKLLAEIPDKRRMELKSILKELSAKF
jgi:DNA-binding MarR family transcriptional regulator